MFFFDLDRAQDINIHVRIKSSEETLRKGYYVNGTKKDFFTISKNRIEKIEVNEDEIIIYFTAVIEGQEIKLKLVEQEFYYFKWQEDSPINITENNIEILEPGEEYSFMFYLTSSDFDPDDYIEKIISTRVDNEYILIDLKFCGILESEKF
jgi:hypothetical protein